MKLRLVSLLLLGTLLRADALADLRAALTHLNGQTPVKARIQYQFWSRQGDAKAPVITEGQASAQVEEGPQGLRMSWSPDLLQAAAREAQAQAANPEAKAPTRQALEGLKALTASDALDGAKSLLGLLENAQVLDVREEAWQGQPARRLDLKLAPKLSKQDQKYVKEFQASAKVWIGPDGLPLAAETNLHLKGRALLVIAFEQQEHETFRFARSGNRLVVLHHAKESSGSGGGEQGQRKSVVDLSLG
ncbi:MAG TPA: hypothetical protein VF768_09250 [Holophagaceae bacterium]